MQAVNVPDEIKLPQTLASILVDYLNYSPQQLREFAAVEKKMKIDLLAYLRGQCHGGHYTPFEQCMILEDLKRLWQAQLSNTPASAKPLYVSNGGAPGVGKTFAMANMFQLDPEHPNPINAIYVAPDHLCLRQLMGYRIACRQSGLGQAYKKWRDASNFIAYFMLIAAIAQRKNILHDTTASSAKVKKVYRILKQFGYAVDLNLYLADPESRIKANAHRAKTFVQLTKEDQFAKAKMSLARILDTYPEWADHLTLYLQPSMFHLGTGLPEKVAEFKQGKIQPEHQLSKLYQHFIDELGPAAGLEYAENFESVYQVLPQSACAKKPRP